MKVSPTTDELPFLVLAAANALVESIQSAMAHAGYTDLRPAHGFAFVRLAGAGCTVGQLADHLGVTKQAASKLVDELARQDYVARSPHPDDGRAVLLVLSDKGRAATRAASQAATDAVSVWASALEPGRIEQISHDLSLLAGNSGVRPTW